MVNMIEYCETTHEFLEKYYDTDIVAILCKVVPMYRTDRDAMESCRSTVVSSLLSQKRVEKFDSSRGMRFSSYLFISIKSLAFNHLKESHRDRNFKNCVSLSAPVSKHDPNYTILDSIVDPRNFYEGVDIRLSVEKMRKKLVKQEAPSNIQMWDLLDGYVCGFNDSEIATIVDMTVAGIGAKKRVLRNMLQHYL